MEDTTSCPAFLEREEDTFSFSPSVDSPTISRLTSRFGNSVLSSPLAGSSPSFPTTTFSSTTPSSPPRFSLSTPRKTPGSPTVAATPNPTTPYNTFLKRRVLYSPRRASSVTSLPITWEDETKTLSSSDDILFTSPSTRKRGYRDALTQSTMDFSTLIAQETKARLLESSPYKEEEPVPCVLPLIPQSNSDFNRIDPETVVDLIEGKYKDSVENFVIMDCRYGYEFEGGHIKGAINMAPHALFEYFKDIPEPVCSALPKRKLVIIMHCEFSSVRAPKCIEILRSMDRTENFKRGYRWPLVSFPDVYLLHGGYKKFYETQKESCEPQAYIPEKSKEHKLKRQESKRARKQHMKKTNGHSVSKRLVYHFL